jgi:cyclase
MSTEYTRGLHELGDGLFAYLQPDGGWGLSNAGLVTGDGASLLVDTLFDLRLTQDMLNAMRPVTETRPIRSLLNTHGNGDHCYGNQLVPDDATIYASEGAAEDMAAVPPGLMAMLQQTDLGEELNAFVEYAFGAFRFDDIEFRAPDETFSGSLALDVGGRRVEVTEVGPAHTAGDVIAHVPDARAVFTGDILFIEGTPIMWVGPVANWLAACDHIEGLDVDVVVPGHGRVVGKEGPRMVRRYLEFVRDEATARHAAGMDPFEAALDIDLGEFADWGDPERICINVDSLYRERDSAREPTPAPELFARMQRYRARR